MVDRRTVLSTAVTGLVAAGAGLFNGATAMAHTGGVDTAPLGHHPVGPRHGGRRHLLYWDDFRAGFPTDGPDARWRYIAVGDYVADDGIVSTSRHGLTVVSSGTNPRTGKPAFVRTLAQDDENGLGLPGLLDHIKWFAFTTAQASTGYPGYDVAPGQILSYETWLSARTYGVENHPFGPAVKDPQGDLRLAAVTMSAVDEEHGVVFDFFVTNTRIYAFYERLPGQRASLGNYAAFSYAIPVVSRRSTDRHHLEITYDRGRGTARWFVDGRLVYQVDRLGLHLPSRKHLAIDHGGEPRRVEPKQITCGLGLLSLLDGQLPGQPALVRLSSAENFYFDPRVGEPKPQTFLDDESLPGNRLFGQGARLDVSKVVVTRWSR